MQKGCVEESTIWLKMVSFSLLFDTLQGTTHEESIASMLHRIFLYLMHWIIFLSSYTFNSVILNLSDINAWDNQSMHFFSLIYISVDGLCTVNLGRCTYKIDLFY